MTNKTVLSPNVTTHRNLVIVLDKMTRLAKKMLIGNQYQETRTTVKSNANWMMNVQALNIIRQEKRILNVDIGSLKLKEMVKQVQISNADSRIKEIL